MFQEVDYLGQGAFGDVLKVKCLQSTSLSEDGASRIKMDAATVKRAKQERIKAEIVIGGGASSINNQQSCIDKPLFEDENYVIKVINVANLNQKAQFDALNEIETMQVMNSPFVVGYFDSFIDDDDEEPKINIVIEYCPNGDLSNFITKQSLEHMHSKNYIHRDLKTLNIFMAKENVAKIGDLGCALNLSKLLPIKKKDESNIKDIEMVVEPSEEGMESPRYLFDEGEDQNLLSLNETNLLSSLHSSEKKQDKKDNKKQVNIQQTSVIDQEDIAGCPESELDDENPVGTPYYLSPEIWKEKRYSRASDIWALGVILYELLNLKKPFPAQDKEELINKVYTQQPEKIRAGISQAFQTLVQGMLKREAKKRLTIEEIIFSEDFQKMSQKLKINLPLKLNKEKLQQKIISNQLQNTDVKLTPYLEKLFEKELKTINNLPKINSQGQQNQNLQNLKQKQQQVIQKQTTKVENLVKRASLKIQSKDQKVTQKSSSNISIISNNDKNVQSKLQGKINKQDNELEKKNSAISKEEQKIIEKDITKYTEQTILKKVNSNQHDQIKNEVKETSTISSTNTSKNKNIYSNKLIQQSYNNKIQSQQTSGIEINKNIKDNEDRVDQINRNQTKSSQGLSEQINQKPNGLSSISSQALVSQIKGKTNLSAKQTLSTLSSQKKGKDIDDQGTASKVSVNANSSVVTTPRGQDKPGTTGKRDIFSKKNSYTGSQGTGSGTVFLSEAQRNSKIFGDLVQSQGNNNFQKKKDSVDQSKPKHNFKGVIKNNELQQEVISQKLFDTLPKKDISSKNSADATMDLEERLSNQNSSDSKQKLKSNKEEAKTISAPTENKIIQIQQPQDFKKEEGKMNQIKIEKQATDSISNNSQVMKFEYGAESPTIEDKEDVGSSLLKQKQKTVLQKDLKNQKDSKIPRTSQISESAQQNQLRLNKGKPNDKDSTKPQQKRQSLKEQKIILEEDGKYQASKVTRESIGGYDEKKKTGSASKNKNVSFRNSIIVNPIKPLNDNRRTTIIGSKNQNTSRPSMLTQRKMEDNPFEKAESIKSKNLLSVRIEPKKDVKKDKQSAGLPVKSKIEKVSKNPSLNSSQKSSKSFVNRGPITRQKTFATKKTLQKNLMVTDGSDDERMNPFASVQEPEICPFENNIKDNKKSANTSVDSLQNIPVNTENELVSGSGQIDFSGLRSVRLPNNSKNENSPQKVFVLDEQPVKQPLSTRSGAGKSFQAFLQAHNFQGGTRPTSSTIKISSSNLSKELIEELNNFHPATLQEQKSALVDFKERMLRNSKSQSINENENSPEIFQNDQNNYDIQKFQAKQEMVKDAQIQYKPQLSSKMSVIPESPATNKSLTSPLIGGNMVTNEKIRQFSQKILSGKVDLKPDIKQDSPFKYQSDEKSPKKLVQPQQVSSGLKTISDKVESLKSLKLEKVQKENQDQQVNQNEVMIEWTDQENEEQEIPLRQQIEQEHQFMSPAFARKPVNNQNRESDFQGPPSLQFQEGRKRTGTLITPSRLKVTEEVKQEIQTIKEQKQQEEKKNNKSNLNQPRGSQKSDQQSSQTTPLRRITKKEPQKLSGGIKK